MKIGSVKNFQFSLKQKKLLIVKKLNDKNEASVI